MEDLSELREKLIAGHPVFWEQMPDIPLYMDQIVSYLSRQLLDYGGDEKMTPAMINNYIKDGLLPRAEGKKYSREHIARLTAIAALKQILPVKNIKTLLDGALSGFDSEEFYNGFCEMMGAGMTAAALELKDNMTDDEIIDAAMRLAVNGYCQRLICKKLIDTVSEKQPKNTRNGNAK